MIRWGVPTAAIAAEVVTAARDTDRARFVAVAVAQAGVVEAVARSAATGRPVEP